MSNLPVTLYAGMKIGQISFLRLTTPAENLYGSAALGSKYQGQTVPTPQPHPPGLPGRTAQRFGLGADRPAVRLPNAPQARVDEEKITPVPSRARPSNGTEQGPVLLPISAFARSSGGSSLRSLRSHGARHEVVNVVDSEYGTRYSIDGSIETPDGRRPGGRTVWQVDREGGDPRLVTAYPL